MNTVNLLLGGAIAYMILKRIGNKVKSAALTAEVTLDYFTTPFNPGVVQYGKLKIYNNSANSITINSLSLTPSDVQISQSGKEVYIKSTRGVMSTQIEYDNKYYSGVMDDLNITIPAYASLTLDISIQVVQYTPAGDPVVSSDDFEKKPFIALLDLDINGAYKHTLEAEYSTVKK